MRRAVAFNTLTSKLWLIYKLIEVERGIKKAFKSRKEQKGFFLSIYSNQNSKHRTEKKNFESTDQYPLRIRNGNISSLDQTASEFKIK